MAIDAVTPQKYATSSSPSGPQPDGPPPPAEAHASGPRTPDPSRHAPFALIEWGRDRRITRWEGAAEALFGWEAREAVGQDPHALGLLRDEDAPLIAVATQNPTRADRPHVAFRIRTLTRSGEVRFCEWTSTVLTDAGGGVSSVLSFVIDRTAERRSEERADGLETELQELRRNHQTFHSLIQNSPLGVYAVDADFKLRVVSAGAQKVFSNVRPLIGRDFAEVLRIIWTEPFASVAVDIFRRTLATGEPYVSASTVERRNDTAEVEAYDWRIERTTMPDGRPGVVCYFYDLSERQRWEEQIRESEARFRIMADSAPVLIWMSGLRKEGIYFNKTWLDFTGRPEQEQLGDGWLKLVHPDDRAGLSAACAEGFRARRPFTAEFRLLRADGEYRWLLDTGSPRFTPAGVYTGFIGSCVDITDRKRAEEALRRNEHRLNTILQATPTMVYFMDRRSRFVHINRALEQLLGMSAQSIAGRSVYDLFPAETARAFEENNQRVIDAGGPIQFEETAAHPDGERCYTSVKAPLFDENGEILGVVGVSTDITDRKRIEEELRLHREHLEALVAEQTAALGESMRKLHLSERMAALGTLSAGLGHDMGNLLLPVRMRLEALEGMNLPAPAAEELAAIRSSTDYLQRLASGLRLLAVDPGRGAAAAATELASWWAEVRAVLRTNLSSGVSLVGRFPENPSLVAIPRAALTQCVFNLVQNAGAAIRAQGAGAGAVTVWAEPHGAVWRLGVTDTGPGMSDEVRRRCMEPFFTTKTRGISTGLGLALVYGLVQESGGTVEIESEPEKGTTFILLLPAAAPPAAGAAPAPRRAIVRMADERMRGFVAAELEALGFRIQPAGAGPADVMVVDSLAAETRAPCRAIVLDDPARVPRGAVALGPRPRPQALRDALRRVAEDSAPGKPVPSV